LQIGLWFKKRLSTAPEELADALCNQPREVIFSILQDWQSKVMDEMAVANKKSSKGYTGSMHTKVTQWQKPK